MEELNPQEQKVAKDIVAKVVIKVAHIQRVLLKSGIVPSPESIWTLSDLRQQIWNDMKANPEFIETIKKVSTCHPILYLQCYNMIISQYHAGITL